MFINSGKSILNFYRAHYLNKNNCPNVYFLCMKTYGQPHIHMYQNWLTRQWERITLISRIEILYQLKV